tara:strand:+ start:2116 stop:2394 length:279 start_codon:yes stop_codon:yes gene_type:complete
MFKPVNRYIHIQIPEIRTPERTSGIVLPADYSPVQETHVSAKVKGWAADVRFSTDLKKDCEIIIDRSMIEEIIVNKEKITMVLDNYVIAIIS